MKKILITGAAGFIGYHIAGVLAKKGKEVVGIDNLNSYYDVKLKLDRVKNLEQFENFRFIKASIDDRAEMSKLFSEEGFDAVVNLAAQPGVRYSIENPYVYIESNITGFLNVLEGCRQTKVKHLVYASSSSVYGANRKIPYSIHDNVDHPISLYAATKKSGELMAHAYSALYKFPVTGLRFFTVYGPWGRPDMALFIFTKAILEEKPINIFNNGEMLRDFTFVDDIAKMTAAVLDKPASPDSRWNGSSPDPATSFAPYRLYNIGNHQPVNLNIFIETLEECLGKKAIKNYLPLQPGDVYETYADISELTADFGFKPATELKEGVRKFVEWYREYYK